MLGVWRWVLGVTWSHSAGGWNETSHTVRGKPEVCFPQSFFKLPVNFWCFCWLAFSPLLCWIKASQSPHSSQNAKGTLVTGRKYYCWHWTVSSSGENRATKNTAQYKWNYVVPPQEKKKNNLHLALEISNNWMKSLGEDMKNQNTEKKDNVIKQTTHYWGKKRVWTSNCIQYAKFA